MATKLTTELQLAIAAHPGEPFPVVDDAGQTFYIIPEARLTHLEALARDESQATLERLQALIAEGDASPDVSADEAEKRILRMAHDADAKYS